MFPLSGGSAALRRPATVRRPIRGEEGWSALYLRAAVIGFILSSIYFWLLNRFEDSGLIWWLILIAGLVIGLV